eukprot:Pompholyxophrys_punicea_v1_NODE_97_length_3517_cov_29.967081.p1 type:complete len:496 gc:universal NODE_97_length_3517_cov_29.967081:1547-3034(+)
MATQIESEFWRATADLIPEDNSTQSFEYNEYLCQNATSLINTNTNQFRNYEIVVEDQSSYLVLSKAYLAITVNLFDTTNNANYAANEKVALANAMSTCIWDNVELRINNQSIEKVDYAYLHSFIWNLLEYQYDYSRSLASNEGWFPDRNGGTFPFINPYYTTFNANGLIVTPGAAFVPNTALPVTLAAASGIYTSDQPLYNPGFQTRCSLLNNSSSVVLRIPLSRLFPFCKYYKGVIVGSRIQVLLYRADDNICCQHTTAAGVNADAQTPALPAVGTARVLISKLSMWLPKAIPSLAQEVKLRELMFSAQSIPISWANSNVIKSPTYITTDLTPKWMVSTLREKPIKAFFFIKHVGQDTTQETNSFVFQSNNVIQLFTRLGSVQYPSVLYQPNFATNDYHRLYDALARTCHKDDDPESGIYNISYSDFSTMYPLFVFDFSYQPEDLFSNGGSQELWFEARLSANAADNYNIYCLLQSDRNAMINIADKRMTITQA